jgi:hypothetical protein
MFRTGFAEEGNEPPQTKKPRTNRCERFLEADQQKRLVAGPQIQVSGRSRKLMNRNIHAAESPRNRRPFKKFSRARKRLREIERTISDRHGSVPETDDADLYLSPVANCFHVIAAERGRAVTVDGIVNLFGLWCQTWAPHVIEQQVVELAREALAGPPKLIADDIVGSALRLSYADRLRLKISTIGSFDADKALRTKFAKARRRERDRLRAAEKRKANGATPRANSLSQTKPWEADGISRRTYERRLRTRETQVDANSSPHPSCIKGRNCDNESQPWLALGISKATYYRRRARETRGDESASPHPSINMGRRTCDMPSCGPVQPGDSRAPKAPRRLAPPPDDDVIDVVSLPIVVHREVLEGEIVVDRGVAVAPPPTSHTQRAMAFVRKQMEGRV